MPLERREMMLIGIEWVGGSLKALGKDAVLPCDQFPQNYKILIKLLNDRNIPLEYHDNILQVMNIAATLKSIETPENVKKYLQLWKDVSNQMSISKEDETWYSKKKNWVYKHRENELEEIKLRDKQDKIKKGFWYEAKVFGTHSILNGSARDH